MKTKMAKKDKTQKIINTETGRVITKSLRTSEGTAGISFN